MLRLLRRASGQRACSLARRCLHTQQQLERHAGYARLRDDDVAAFKQIVGDKGVVTDAHELEPYNR